MLRQPSPATTQVVESKQPIAPITRSTAAPQNQLLELFKKPNPGAMASPDTPISPFTLGSPNVARYTASATPFPPTQSTQAQTVRMAGGDSSRKGSGSGTPTETKGFLLDYLNGVVQKEGRRA